MSVEVEFSDELVNEAKRYAEINACTVEEQIELWIQLGRLFENSLSKKKLREFLKHPENYRILICEK